MMKKHSIGLIAVAISATVVLSSCGSGSSSQINNGWEWQSGSSESNAFSIYGTEGKSASTNVPGARWGGVSWQDESGNFWLFGGDGNAATESGNLNDLWKYNPNTKQWSWMSGSTSPGAYGVYGVQNTPSDNNTPGARSGGVSWRDNAGNLWMFGGLGHAENNQIPGYMNDMWEYNPNTNQWTWQNGKKEVDLPGIYGKKGVVNSINNPGSRIGATSWTDGNGNLWMFGGVNATAKRFNDLWKYNTNTKQWTWMSGESTPDESGVYGTQGTASIENYPGARYDAISWIDNNGNVWIFGGRGNDETSNVGLLNDLWKYDPESNVWTWIKGSKLVNQNAVYGTQNIASDSNTPGARNHRTPFAWSDKNGNLWMLGGVGLTGNGHGVLNDLWTYSPTKNQWIWVSGSSESGAFGIYGAGGTNVPGARHDAIGWIDAYSNLWVFGGSGNGATTTGNLNDLWKYNNIGAESLFPVTQYTAFSGYNSSSTFVTGIRQIKNSSDVYISAIAPSTTASVGLIYAGPLSGQGGKWYQINFPASLANGATVSSTNLYGPNNGSQDGYVNVVGSYNTVESGPISFGVFYHGALTDGDNPNNWTVLAPPNAASTIIHSNMGDLIAGNYNVVNDPAGKAFIYNMIDKDYTLITKPNAVSITIYGIWHNGGTKYTFAGGYSNTNESGLDVGYIADYDSATKTVSHWTEYPYNNISSDSIVSHFEGITSDGNGGYNLAADVFALGSLKYGVQTNFVHITRNQDGTFNPLAVWTDVLYPNAVLSSANTVYENNLLGVYAYTLNLTQVNSFIATVPSYR